VYLYTLWCLQRAKHHGLRKLYFLARDAYLPYLAARQIIAEHPDAFDIEVSYLLGSRQTYDALSIDRLGPGQWDQLTKHAEHQYTTPRMLQTSLMARRQTFQTLLEKLGLGGRGWDQPLTRGLGPAADPRRIGTPPRSCAARCSIESGVVRRHPALSGPAVAAFRGRRG